ncbi:Uncharacterised protein [Actinomyces bovis]|uniref:DNA-binding protein n=1 Tax=Actinomyces bovis TaxID=1658 RepID=A0ABY1VKJ8_9ACTO|nr:hypothetical protein [Actinomyces bovis]SPT52623.1 Uncharacterised protein [Actinomyces bovis]VEG54486.1 Uncharacterised protein [Actinomyces israelii]
MTVLDEVLADLSLTEEELAELLRREASGRARAGAAPLSAGMSSFLRRSTPIGAHRAQAQQIIADRSYAEQLSAQQRARAAATQLARSLSTKEVAALLHKDPSSITRAAGHKLYAYHTGRALRFPTWQFIEGRPLPGLSSVVPQLRPGLAPATVAARMTTADPELLDGLSPVDWLRQGGDPSEVVRLLDEADHR